MLEASPAPVYDLAAALCCGALIGVEREHGKGGDRPRSDEPPDTARLAGIRTHTLVAILGGLGRVLDRAAGASPWFSALGFVAIVLFVVVAHAVRAARTGMYGMTSVPTLFLTYGLGALACSGERVLALGLAVVVTGVLAVKVPVHAFVRALAQSEIMAAIKFGLVALVLLPVLPDHDYGPRDWPWLYARLRELGFADEGLAGLDLFNPYKLWLLVVAISGLGFVGYVVVRVLGPGRGLVLTGLAGGLVSSTSVTLAMADQSRRAPEWKRPIVAAVLAACAVMAVRVIIVAVAVHPPLFGYLVLPVGALMGANLLLALLLARRRERATHEGTLRAVTPLALQPAIKLAGLILAVRLVAELAVLAVGYQGLLATAVLSGIVDVDAINVAASQQAAAGHVHAELAAIAICVAVAANTVAKGAMLLATGDRATGRLGSLALLATLAVGAAGLGAVLATAG